MTVFGAEAVAESDRVLQAGVADGLWPGVVAAVGGPGPAVQRRWVLGAAENWSGGFRAMAGDTVFDLASLTKVLATTPAVLLLVQRGELRLDDPVGRYVPGVDGRVRVYQLLTHTSGLPAHADLRPSVRSAADLVRAAARQALIAEPGTVVTYSDLGFILLGGVVAAVTGEPLPEFTGREVFEPLGASLWWNPPPEEHCRTAATELVEGVPLIGRVHDENAAAGGGVAGHAGLFGPLDAVVHCLASWFAGGPLLTEPVRAGALRDRTAGLGGHRGLGWTCRGDRYDILSTGWGVAAVSHTGFTGTSVALDPGTGRWAVLLTNAVHFGRGRDAVFAARRRWHAALVGD